MKPAFVEGITFREVPKRNYLKVEVVLSNFGGGVSRWDYMGSGEFRFWPTLSCLARFTQVMQPAFTGL